MLIYTGRALLAAALIGALALSGCSSNDDDKPATKPAGSSSSSSSSSSGASIVESLGNVQVHYPPQVSSTSAETVTVRGITQDPAVITALYVNGTAVTTDDGLANWTFTAPLASGINTLAVEAEGADGIRSEVTRIAIERAVDIVTPKAMAHDRANSRVLLIDRTHQSIVAVDLATGSRSQFSPSETSAQNLLTNPRGVVLDEANNRLLVYQSQVKAVVDETETPEDTATEGAEEPAEEDGLDDIASPAEAHPYISVDLTTGEQTIFEYTPPPWLTVGNTPLAMAIGDGIAYVADVELFYTDASGKRVTKDAEGAKPAAGGIINTMDLVTGEMQAFSGYGIPDTAVAPQLVEAMTTSSDADRLFLLEYMHVDKNVWLPRVSTISKEDGTRTVLQLDRSVDGDGEEAIVLGNPFAISLDSMNQRLLLLSGRRVGETRKIHEYRVLAVDLATNKLTVLSEAAKSEGRASSLSKPEALAFDAISNTIYLADDAANAVVVVDGTSGERELLAGPTAGPTLSTPSCLALAPELQSLLVCDKVMGAVFEHDLVSGAMTKAADSAQYTDTRNLRLLRSPVAAVEREAGRFLILDQFNDALLPKIQATVPRLLELGSGLTELYALPGYTLQDIAYHAGRDSAYVAAAVETRAGPFYVILELQLGQGEVSERLVSGGATPDSNYMFRSLKSIALDYGRDRILAVDSALDAIIAVDRSSGKRTPLSSPAVPEDGGPGFKLPQAITIDTENDRALVLDSARDAIIAVDLETGRRSIVYQSTATDAVPMINGRDIVMHPFGYVLVIDDVKDTVMAIDLSTQQAVTLTD